jgi:hypothetical protein
MGKIRNTKLYSETYRNHLRHLGVDKGITSKLTLYFSML